MLEKLRTQVKGWLGMVILVMISIPFALFGLQNYTSGGSEAPLAEVAGQEIYQADLNRAYQQRVEELKKQYGDQYSPNMFNEESIRQEALNRLVQEKLILHTVDKDGYVASDAAILDVVAKLDGFQNNGQFEKAKYEEFLQRKGISSAAFLQNIRSNIEQNQFISAIVDTTLVDNSEVDNFYRLNNQTRDIRYLSLTVESVLSEMTASDEEINKNYAENEHLYKVPEYADIDYVELSISDLMLDIKPTEDELLAFYESEKLSFTSLGQRRASHMLFDAPEGTTVAESEKKKAEAEKVLSRIKNGEDFATLAKEFSDDIGSANIGGDLGIITEGMMGLKFEDTLSVLQEGEVSEVIQTIYGFQIIKLTKKAEDKIQPFSAVKSTVKERLIKDIASEEFYQMAERFAEIGFENPGSLDPLVEELGLTIKQQLKVTKEAGEGIAESDSIRNATFSEDVLAGNNSDAVELGPEHLVVLRIKEYIPESVMPLDSVKAVVELSVKAAKAAKALSNRADELLTKAKSGASIKELAALDGVALQEIGEVTRNESTAPRELLRDAFSMSHPQNGQSTFKKSTFSNGDIAIIELSKITDGEKSDITDESRSSFKQFLARLTGEVTLAATLTNLSVDADVVFAKPAE